MILSVGLLILISHYVVDTYTALVPPLLGVVEANFHLTPRWTALFLGSGALFSGLAQPLYAWLSDRMNTRLFAGLGLLLAGLGVTTIGYAGSPALLFALYALGMMGVGMYHPVAVSTIGRLAGDRRSWAISWFFVFGMGGWFTGSLAGPALASGNGSLRNLAYLLLPGLVVGCLLYFSIRHISHKRPVQEHESASLKAYDWRSITFLYLSSVFRFMVNMGLIYLLLRWTELDVAAKHPDWTDAEIADFSAPMVGWANAAMIVGQAIGGLSAGALLKVGHEKRAMILVPILFAPVVACFSLVSPGLLGFLVCCLSGIGFAAMTPVAISLGQRMMPFHTSLGSALMLGAAWAVASLGPRIAEITVQAFSLSAGFLVVAVFLLLSGLTAVGIKNTSIRSAGETFS